MWQITVSGEHVTFFLHITPSTYTRGLIHRMGRAFPTKILGNQTQIDFCAVNLLNKDNYENRQDISQFFSNNENVFKYYHI